MIASSTFPALPLPVVFKLWQLAFWDFLALFSVVTWLSLSFLFLYCLCLTQFISTPSIFFMVSCKRALTDQFQNLMGPRLQHLFQISQWTPHTHYWIEQNSFLLLAAFSEWPVHCPVNSCGWLGVIPLSCPNGTWCFLRHKQLREILWLLVVHPYLLVFVEISVLGSFFVCDLEFL